MIDDPITVAGLVDREVRRGSRDGEPTRVVVARRTYATDQHDLWNALTDPERLPRWFLPVTGDLVPGGRYQLEGNAGGVVEHCEEPTSFSVTWEYEGAVSWLAVTLTPADDGTTLELAHEAPVDPEFWDRFGPGATGVGWELGLVGLGRHLESGAAVDPGIAEAFPTTTIGATFVERSAAAWADAAAADGDEPEAARDAAARTVAFYTGADEPDAS